MQLHAIKRCPIGAKFCLQEICPVDVFFQYNSSLHLLKPYKGSLFIDCSKIGKSAPEWK